MLQSTASKSALTNWSLLQAGQEVMLAVPQSAGRYPCQLMALDPEVSWRRADGHIEVIEFGSDADARPVVLRELLTRGLLMVEVDSSGGLCGGPWLIHTGQRGANVSN